jgi:hypothetical protein
LSLLNRWPCHYYAVIFSQGTVIAIGVVLRLSGLTLSYGLGLPHTVQSSLYSRGAHRANAESVGPKFPSPKLFPHAWYSFQYLPSCQAPDYSGYFTGALDRYGLYEQMDVILVSTNCKNAISNLRAILLHISLISLSTSLSMATRRYFVGKTK